MNVLILGAAGFVGTNLVRRCIRDGHRVVAIDMLDPESRSSLHGLRPVLGDIEFIRADARDVRVLEKYLPGQDAVLNCAGQTSHVLSLHDPLRDLELNCNTALRLLETARRLNPEAIHLYPSSSTVIGRSDDVADEDSPQRPRDFYSAHKATIEHYYRIYHEVYGLPVLVLRFGNLYGPFGKAGAEFGFINHFIARALRGEDITVFGDGAQKRNLLFIDDAVEAMLVAVREPRLRGQPYFVLGDETLSVREIAERVARTLGSGGVVTAPFPEQRRGIDPGSVRLTDGRFRRLTAWRPHITLDGGLARIRNNIDL